MADETPTPPVETPVETPAVAPAPSPLEEMAELRRNVAALADVVKTSLTARQPVYQQPGQAPQQPLQITPEIRQMLRAEGLTDADIDHNAQIVQPFIRAALRQVAPEIVGLVGNVANDVEMVKAGRNKKTYPDWDTVEDKVTELRENAQKAGQYLTVRQAYEAAVALDPEGVSKARQSARAASVARDATVQGSIGRNVGGRANTAGGGLKTKDELRSMTPEQRKAYWASVENLPIQ